MFCRYKAVGLAGDVGEMTTARRKLDITKLWGRQQATEKAERLGFYDEWFLRRPSASEQISGQNLTFFSAAPKLLGQEIEMA